MRTFAIALSVAGLLAAGPAPAGSPPSVAPGWVAAAQVPAGQSLVVIHNASGRTAFGASYVVNFDGSKVAKLARGQYTAVVIPAGEHRGWVGSFRKQSFRTEPDRVTHYVVAYSPAKSWGAPFAGTALAYGVVPDSVGAAMTAGQEWVEPLVPLAPVPAPSAPDSAGGGR